MKQYNGFKPELSLGGSKAILPAGGYIARVLNVKEESTQWGTRLVINFDIADGEFTNFFRKDNDQQSDSSSYEKKWRGVYRVTEPKDDGSQDDSYRIRTMNNVIAAFEASNPNYHWSWNESTLKNLYVGVLYRNKEWEINGKRGWTTECCKLTDANLIRNGDFKIPADKPLKNNNNTAIDIYGAPPHTDADFAASGVDNYSDQWQSTDGELPF